MRIFMMLFAACILVAIAGCYPVGHRYHDGETHRQQMEQINNPDSPDGW